MALHDARNLLASNQVISATTLSQRYLDFNALADYGVGHLPIFLTTIIKGQFTHDLRIQLLATEEEDGDFSNPIVVADSGLTPADELYAGKVIPVLIPPTNKKYRAVCARFIPSRAESSEGAGDGVLETTDITGGTPYVVDSTFNPPAKVGDTNAEVADAVDCFLTSEMATDLYYPNANDGKATGG